MARILWLNWSGGGNLPPSLGIARVLTERGHDVTFAGRPEMVPRVEAAGFRAIEFKHAYAQVDRYPQGSPLTRAACYLTSPAVEAEARSIVATQAPDVILVDAMFPAALAQTPGFGHPTALVCHTFVFRQLDMWRKMFALLDGMRGQAGFDGLPPLDDLWLSTDRIVCTALAAFDASPVAGWELVRHAGPVLENETVAAPANLPWLETDPTPLVLVSFSTGFEQRSVDKLQRALDALRELPVHVVATTGGIVDPNELHVPANAVALNYAAHDPILRRAALAVTHGGHGTAMRSLRHGVPMVLMPGLAADQPYIAALAQEWGVGRALAGDADVEAIRSAAHEVLTTPSYRKRATERAAALRGVDGASAAADEIEELAVSAASPVTITTSTAARDPAVCGRP
ncbi:MAG TPA: nucleotide disphospho-sugar-binding domain-containing protein [Pseudolabrys sp.]|nr:nucleotide disphospho-sugar-binding domain-containing protein [Pseudolabrys sp.]